jgi:hypothetical protein
VTQPPATCSTLAGSIPVRSASAVCALPAATMVPGPAAYGGGPLGIVPQLDLSPGLPSRPAVQRRKDRVMGILHTLPASRAAGHPGQPQSRGPLRCGASGPGSGRAYGAHPAGAGDVTRVTAG